MKSDIISSQRLSTQVNWIAPSCTHFRMHTHSLNHDFRPVIQPCGITSSQPSNIIIICVCLKSLEKLNTIRGRLDIVSFVKSLSTAMRWRRRHQYRFYITMMYMCECYYRRAELRQHVIAYRCWIWDMMLQVPSQHFESGFKRPKIPINHFLEIKGFWSSAYIMYRYIV